jgi:hypothetical protein
VKMKPALDLGVPAKQAGSGIRWHPEQKAATSASVAPAPRAATSGGSRSRPPGVTARHAAKPSAAAAINPAPITGRPTVRMSECGSRCPATARADGSGSSLGDR